MRVTFNELAGDMVRDAAAGKDRDLEITVTLEEADGKRRAFKAYEVNARASPWTGRC